MRKHPQSHRVVNGGPIIYNLDSLIQGCSFKSNLAHVGWDETQSPIISSCFWHRWDGCQGKRKQVITAVKIFESLLFKALY